MKITDMMTEKFRGICHNGTQSFTVMDYVKYHPPKK